MGPPPILITGFQPFVGLSRNPSGEVVEAVQAAAAVGEIVSAVLPVEYSRAVDQLLQLIDTHKPSAWLGLGLHQRACAITLERLAANLDDASIADNNGDLRQGLLIDPDGPPTYASTLPLEQIHLALRERQIPVVYSDNAGRYVCNHLFYAGRAAVVASGRWIPVGFIHLPWPADWASIPLQHHKINLNHLITATKVAIQVIHENS